MVICLERGADLHMVQPMPLTLTVSCFTKIQIGFTFLVLDHPGSPGQRAIKRVCVFISGITISPVISKLFESILLHLYDNFLASRHITDFGSVNWQTG